MHHLNFDPTLLLMATEEQFNTSHMFGKTSHCLRQQVINTTNTSSDHPRSIDFQEAICNSGLLCCQGEALLQFWCFVDHIDSPQATRATERCPASSSQFSNVTTTSLTEPPDGCWHHKFCHNGFTGPSLKRGHSCVSLKARIQCFAELAE